MDTDAWLQLFQECVNGVQGPDCGNLETSRLFQTLLADSHLEQRCSHTLHRGASDLRLTSLPKEASWNLKTTPPKQDLSRFTPSDFHLRPYNIRIVSNHSFIIYTKPSLSFSFKLTWLLEIHLQTQRWGSQHLGFLLLCFWTLLCTIPDTGWKHINNLFDLAIQGWRGYSKPS